LGTVLCLSASSLQARVKLVALPDRGKMVVSLLNPAATLVEEERTVALQRGGNDIDFSWKGVQLDQGSIQVRPLTAPDKIRIVSTSFPPNENALIWNVQSSEPVEARFRISYLIYGLERDVIYKAVAEPDEKALNLRSYVRIRNNSGEEFTDAEFHLPQGSVFKRSVSHEEIVEIQSDRKDLVPMKKVLTWDAATTPWVPEYENKTVGLPMSYELLNTKGSKLGGYTLEAGKARIFIKTRDPGAAAGSDPQGVTFSGEDWAVLTPVDRDMKLSIGQSRDVKVIQRQTKNDRTNIRRNNKNQDVVWDTDEVMKIEVENFKKSPAELVLVEHIQGFWKISESTHPHTRKDAFTLEFKLSLPAESVGDKKTVITYSFNRFNVSGQEPSSY